MLLFIDFVLEIPSFYYRKTQRFRTPLVGVLLFIDFALTLLEIPSFYYRKT